MVDFKKALIRARCRKFASHCKANPCYAFTIPENLENICETLEETQMAIQLLKDLGLKQHPVSGAWEAA